MFRGNKKSSLWLEVADHKVGLTFWLQAATDGLADPARERIRAEIEGHYAEAVAAHMAEGLAETEARTTAILELGDAKVAAKRFRKQNLTVREAEEIERAFKDIASRWYLLRHYLVFCLSWVACWLLLFRGKPNYQGFAVLFAVGFFGLVIVPTVSFFMVQCKSKNVGYLLLTDVVAYHVILFSLWYCMLGFSYAFFVFVTGCIVLSYGHLRTWFKIRLKIWQITRCI